MQDLQSFLRCFCASPTNVAAASVCYSINPSDNYLMEFCHVDLITSFNTPWGFCQHGMFLKQKNELMFQNSMPKLMIQNFKKGLKITYAIKFLPVDLFSLLSHG